LQKKDLFQIILIYNPFYLSSQKMNLT